MAIVNSKPKLHEEAAREYLASGHPLLLKFDEVVEGDRPAFKGHLIVDGLGTKANTRVTVMQAQGVRGFGSLADAISGTDRTPKLVKGDVVAFSSAYALDGIARVGQISARTHDGMRGKVQVFTAMAKPSQSRVSKKGAYQSVVFTDAKAAVVARSYEEVHAAFNLTAREWPGGARGFIIRDKSGGVGDYFEDKDSGIDFFIDELRLNDAFVQAGDALELIPAWRVQMGREQVARDGQPEARNPERRIGKVHHAV